MFIIWDTKSRSQVGEKYRSRAAARKRADELDAQYGAYRYTVRPL